MQSSKKAFTIIELATIILIIGILIAGLVTASILIKKSKIVAAQSLTKSSPIAGIQENALWLESSLEESFKDNETSTGNAVTTWYDQKNSGNKSSVIAVGTGPTYSNSINNIHAVEFLGSASNYLKIADASFLNNTDYTIVIVEKRKSANAGYFLSTTNTSDVIDSKLALGYASDGEIAHSHNSTNYAVTPKVSSYSDSNDTARTFVFTQSSTFGKKTYINGTLAAEDASNISQLSGVTSLAIGKGYTGEIGEIAIFTRALKNEERKFTEDYLGKKWTQKINRDVSPSCINGTITDSGCASTCTVNVVGITNPSSVSDGASGNLTCSSPYSGTVAYNCSNGNLNPSGSCTQPPTCTITGVTGFNNKSGLAYAASATPISSPCASGYAPSTSPVPSYTCTTSGPATITGTCNVSTPVNSVAPALSTTTPNIGVALSVTTGTWTNSPTSYSYQWYWADTSAVISGATSSSYTAVIGDVGHTLRCNVTATNANGSSSPVPSNTSSAISAPTCTITGVTGFNNKSGLAYATSATVISSPCASGYAPSTPAPSYTCTTTGPATITGTCNVSVATCTGGTITNPSAGVTVHTFKSSGNFQCPTARNVEVLVVAGGGTGGYFGGGGGGAGGVIYRNSFAVSTSQIPVTVGDGGASSTYQTRISGSNSVFSTLTAIGGGGGGNYFNAGLSGGSGGGGSGASGGSGTAGQGNAGGNGLGDPKYPTGGGGGAGSTGQTATSADSTSSGNGGNGVSYSISGSAVTYAGGGGGGSGLCCNTGTCCIGNPGAGGAGGGGAGATSSTNAVAGIPNTGGGGGGGYYATLTLRNGAAGGSGVVIVRY